MWERLGIVLQNTQLLNQHYEQKAKTLFAFKGSFYILRGEADIISINWGDFD